MQARTFSAQDFLQPRLLIVQDALSTRLATLCAHEIHSWTSEAVHEMRVKLSVPSSSETSKFTSSGPCACAALQRHVRRAEMFLK